MSFASEASPKALDKIVAWLRSNIHPQTLLQVGLQPTIAAGCIVRTTNRVFDLSLRTHLREQEPYLTQLIATAAASKD
jgi:F0F1-type ATP synthase delta subunit